jgi:hypothetical protein
MCQFASPKDVSQVGIGRITLDLEKQIFHLHSTNNTKEHKFGPFLQHLV